MTLILISTSWRHTTHREPSGRLLVFDTEKQKIIRSCQIIEPPYREHDPNPRGGLRGLNGIIVEDDLIAIANSATIFLYDKYWRPLKVFWHPSCAGIHDMCFSKGNIWVTSTKNDLVFCFDINGELIRYIDVRRSEIIYNLSSNRIMPFLSKNAILKGKINFRDPRTYDHIVTDTLHVNSFVELDNGCFLISCGLLRIIENPLLHKANNFLKGSPFSKAYSKIFSLFRKILAIDKKINAGNGKFSKHDSISVILKLDQGLVDVGQLVIDECSVPSHSLHLLNHNESIYLNSSSGELIMFNVNDLSITLKTKIGEKFLRGACRINNDSLLLGDNNKLIHYDLDKNQVVSRTLISDDPYEAIFDINVLPEGYALPPESFIDHHKKFYPITQEKRFSLK